MLLDVLMVWLVMLKLEKSKKRQGILKSFTPNSA